MISSFSLPVVLALENGFSLVATGSHMIEGAGNFYPQRAGHFHAIKLPNLLHLEPTYSTHRNIFQYSRPYPFVFLNEPGISYKLPSSTKTGLNRIE